MAAEMVHPSAAYALPYETAERLFGTAMSAEGLIGRVRTFSWRDSFMRLARLAAVVANEPDGVFSERVRTLTVDPIAQLTANNASSAEMLARGRAAVAQRRNQIVLAHEEVISFLQHLILLEGANDGDVPGDPEIALWLAGANGHLARWAKEDTLRLSENDRLAAEMVRILRFNSRRDPARAIVRTNHLFRRRPPTGDFAGESRWQRLQQEAFGSSFEESFETGLALLAMLSQQWGVEDSPFRDPIINVPALTANTRTSQETFLAALTGLTTTREQLRPAITARMRPDGLPHAPTALFHSPLVEVEPFTYAVASPWAVLGQLRTGVWARYLGAAKRLDASEGADEWLRAFGLMFEEWSRFVANAATASTGDRVRIIMPSIPGSHEEVEDIVVIEDGTAIFFSVKGRLMQARIPREAVSTQETISWFEDFFFEQRGADYRGGAVRQLSNRIDKLRRGDFEASGIPRETPVFPVVVTYDALGESDLLYRWLERRCREHGLLRQPSVGPLALARIDEFEQLVSRVARRRSSSELLRRREGADQYRRLDQLLYEAEPPTGPPRLPFFEQEFWLLTNRIWSRFARAQ